MSEAIKNLLQTYQRALNEANIGLVRSIYAKDAVVIGQPFPTATGIEEIISIYTDFLSKLDFNVQFDLLELELSGDLGFIRTRSHGTIVPKGQKPTGSEGNREISIVIFLTPMSQANHSLWLNLQAPVKGSGPIKRHDTLPWLISFSLGSQLY